MSVHISEFKSNDRPVFREVLFILGFIAFSAAFVSFSVAMSARPGSMPAGSDQAPNADLSAIAFLVSGTLMALLTIGSVFYWRLLGPTSPMSKRGIEAHDAAKDRLEKQFGVKIPWEPIAELSMGFTRNSDQPNPTMIANFSISKADGSPAFCALRTNDDGFLEVYQVELVATAATP